MKNFSGVTISNIDIKIATLPKIASRMKSLFCLFHLLILIFIFIKTFLVMEIGRRQCKTGSKMM